MKFWLAIPLALIMVSPLFLDYAYGPGLDWSADGGVGIPGGKYGDGGVGIPEGRYGDGGVGIPEGRYAAGDGGVGIPE